MLRFPPARASSAASLRWLGARRLVRLVRRHDPDVVVSTYPGITVVLGELRRRRRLAVPVAAVITDLAGLFFWAHRGVDMHLLAWAQSAPEVERVSRAANAVHVSAPTDDTSLAPGSDSRPPVRSFWCRAAAGGSEGWRRR
jgi:UDP-N-acetylglucosamine:LPS N-acetylglucosamine transferase